MAAAMDDVRYGLGRVSVVLGIVRNRGQELGELRLHVRYR